MTPTNLPTIPDNAVSDLDTPFFRMTHVWSDQFGKRKCALNLSLADCVLSGFGKDTGADFSGADDLLIQANTKIMYLNRESLRECLKMRITKIEQKVALEVSEQLFTIAHIHYMLFSLSKFAFTIMNEATK